MIEWTYLMRWVIGMDGERKSRKSVVLVCLDDNIYIYIYIYEENRKTKYSKCEEFIMM